MGILRPFKFHKWIASVALVFLKCNCHLHSWKAHGCKIKPTPGGKEGKRGKGERGGWEHNSIIHQSTYSQEGTLGREGDEGRGAKLVLGRTVNVVLRLTKGPSDHWRGHRSLKRGFGYCKKSAKNVRDFACMSTTPDSITQLLNTHVITCTHSHRHTHEPCWCTDVDQYVFPTKWDDAEKTQPLNSWLIEMTMAGNICGKHLSTFGYIIEWLNICSICLFMFVMSDEDGGDYDAGGVCVSLLWQG